MYNVNNHLDTRGTYFRPLKKYLSFTLLPYFCILAKRLQTRFKPNHYPIVLGFPNLFSVFDVILSMCILVARGLVVFVIGQQIQTQTKQTRSRTKTSCAMVLTKTKIKVDKSRFLGSQSEIGK